MHFRIGLAGSAATARKEIARGLKALPHSTGVHPVFRRKPAAREGPPVIPRPRTKPRDVIGSVTAQPSWRTSFKIWPRSSATDPPKRDSTALREAVFRGDCAPCNPRRIPAPAARGPRRRAVASRTRARRRWPRLPGRGAGCGWLWKIASSRLTDFTGLLREHRHGFDSEQSGHE